MITGGIPNPKWKRNVIKHIPNILTGMRIVFALILLLLKPLSILFMAVYLIGGISDIADGIIARKMNTSSKSGAVYDSIADAVFVFVLLFIFLSHFQWPAWLFYWVFAVIVLRGVSLAIGAIKYHVLAFLHTYANKATGLALFSFPFMFWIFDQNTAAFILCCITTISAVEELLINIISTKLDRNISTIFALKKGD